MAAIISVISAVITIITTIATTVMPTSITITVTIPAAMVITAAAMLRSRFRGHGQRGCKGKGGKSRRCEAHLHNEVSFLLPLNGPVQKKVPLRLAVCRGVTESHLNERGTLHQKGVTSPQTKALARDAASHFAALTRA
jgi:hypothetical protein